LPANASQIPQDEPSFLVLADDGDERGSSFAVPHEYLRFLGTAEDMHVACILPGYTRGNHYHVLRVELIVVVHFDHFSIHWDRGADTKPSSRSFEGKGAVAIAIPKHSSHAVVNDGNEPLWLVGTSDGPYDPNAPDAHRRVVSPS
jgi:UDP-2-acetamido-2,6-beta-L-arabino-hexul-4-ose reductase